VAAVTEVVQPAAAVALHQPLLAAAPAEPRQPTPAASKSAKVNRPPPLCRLSKVRLGPVRVFSARPPIPVNKRENWISINVRRDVPKFYWIASITSVKYKVVTLGSTAFYGWIVNVRIVNNSSFV
jgi:hypothetical protein